MAESERARVIGRTLLLSALLTASLPAAGSELYRLLNERLELMQAVAAYKWQHGVPIEDPQREAVVLDAAVAEALRHGLTPASSRTLFAAQIEAAKVIQRHWFEVWAAGGGPAAAPDLDAEIRPQLLRLGEAIIAAAAREGGSVAAQAPAATLTVPGLDVTSRARLQAAVAGLERYPHRLAQILDTGVLRIGTTGDYAPFSHRDDGDAAPVGIDIDLARHLADALGVRPVFVDTSWPSLMDDLAAGRYDIGMSGISRTVERQRRAFLSRPYYVGGKTPVARCDAAQRFASLDAIDRPGVRVLVNPGGTNERFVDTHVHRAQKIVHDDNRTIFDRLAAGAAEVMITDRVEVELQTARRPELCATMAGTLTYQEKGYLLPQDGVWAAFVDTWLELALADGTTARVFRNHGVAPGNGARAWRGPSTPNEPAGRESNTP